MLGSSRQLMDGVLVEDLGLDLKRRGLVVLLAVEQHIVHAESPRIDLLLVPRVHELRPCHQVLHLSLQRDLPQTFYINVLLLQAFLLFFFFLLFILPFLILLLFSLLLLLWLVGLVGLRQFAVAGPRLCFLDAHLLLDFRLQRLLLLLLRVHELVVLSQPELPLVVLPAPQQLSILTQEHREVCASCNIHDVLAPELLDFDGVGTVVVVVEAELSVLVETPSLVGPGGALANLGDSMVSATPQVFHIGKTHSLEDKAVLDLVAFVDAASDGVGFGLSADVDPVGDEYGAVVAAGDDFGEFGVGEGAVGDGGDVVVHGQLHWLVHLLPAHELVVPREVHSPCAAAREHRVVVPRRNQVDHVPQLHLQRQLLRTLATQCALVIAPEREHASFNCGYNRVQCSTGDFANSGRAKRVREDRAFGLCLFLLVLEDKLVEVSEADGALGLVVLARVVVLVGLAGAEDVELEQWRLRLRLGGFVGCAHAC